MRNEHCAGSWVSNNQFCTLTRRICQYWMALGIMNKKQVDSWQFLLMDPDDDDENLCCQITFNVTCRGHGHNIPVVHWTMGQRSPVKYICAHWRCAQSQHFLFLGLLHRNQVCLQSGATDACLGRINSDPLGSCRLGSPARNSTYYRSSNAHSITRYRGERI